MNPSLVNVHIKRLPTLTAAHIKRNPLYKQNDTWDFYPVHGQFSQIVLSLYFVLHACTLNQKVLHIAIIYLM